MHYKCFSANADTWAGAYTAAMKKYNDYCNTGMIPGRAKVEVKYINNLNRTTTCYIIARW